MKKITLILITLILLLSHSSHVVSSTNNSTQSFTDEYVFRRSWGGDVDAFHNPFDVAVAPDGIIYVAERNLQRVVRIDPNLRTYALLGGPGNEVENFSSPTAVAVGESGKIFVVEYQGGIKIFSPSGELIKYWAYQLCSGFLSLGLDSQENVYTTCGHSVLKFSQSGELLMELTGGGTSDTAFNYPWGVDVDQQDNIYVSDYGNNRIQKFNSSGELILIWGSAGSAPGQFDCPVDVAISLNNEVFIQDNWNERIQKFDDNGNFIKEWKNSEQMAGIGVDTQGKIYVTNSYSHNIQVLTNNFNPVITYGSSNLGKGEFYYPHGIAIDAANNVFVVDELHQVQKFNEFGTLLREWDGINGPQGVAVDKNRSFIYVATLNSEILKFTLEGVFLLQWDIQPVTGHEFESIEDLTIDSSGNVYVIVEDGWPDEEPKVQKYDSEGNFLMQWGCIGTAPGCFDDTTGIGIDSSDYIYVTESYGSNLRVQKFDFNGNFIFQKSVPQTTRDVDLDSQGNIYLISYLSAYYPPVTRITPSDVYEYYPYVGYDAGSLFEPNAIAINNKDSLIILDEGNGRIVELSKGLPEPHSYFGLTLNGGFELWPPLNEWTYGGDLPVLRSNHAVQGSYALQLGLPVAQTEQGLGNAWAYSNFYVRPEWDRPVLSFKYNMFVNDIMDYSDFFVAIQDGVGLNHLATVVRDGFQPCIPGVAPSPGRDLGWRSITYDLSAYKGQHIRLVFSNRNLWSNSWGIWTYVDDVRVIDAGPQPPLVGPFFSFLPMINNYRCDSVTLTGLNTNDTLKFRIDPPNK